MQHGMEGYFSEIAHFERRLTAVILSVAAVLLAALWLLPQSATLKRALNDPERFGFEGPERYVRRILLESMGETSKPTPPIAGRVSIQPSHLGRWRAELLKGEVTPSIRGMHSTPRGAFESRAELMARAIARAGGVPVFQSEQLVLVEKAIPVYPEDARNRGLEGRVVIMALVDTTGRTGDMQVIGGDRMEQFDRAAMEAARRCRFQPYHERGVRRDVWALMRFKFELTEPLLPARANP